MHTQNVRADRHTHGVMDELARQILKAATPADALPAIQKLAEDRTRAVILSLIELLYHPNPAIAAAIARELEQLVPESVEPLIAAFSTCTDQNVQAHIVRILACIGDDRALDLLVEVVGTEVANHCQGNVRRVAARGLGKMVTPTTDAQTSHRAIAKLTWALLHTEDWALRYAAAVSLEAIDSATQATATGEVSAALHQALAQEPDRVVRERVRAILNL